jgi:hypothetical protein
MADFKEQYRALFNSPLGEDILKSLEELRQSLVVSAEGEDAQERAYGLLKQASGVNLSVSHLKGKGVNIASKARNSGGE